MTNLWYEIKKLGFMQINTNCKLCQQSLKNFKEHPLKKDEIIVIVPDINCHGKITHFHIARMGKKIIEGTKIDTDLKESDKE